MQSKLAATAAKYNKVVCLAAAAAQKQHIILPQGLSFGTSTGRTADPAVHAVDPEEVDAAEAIRYEKLRHPPESAPTKENDTYMPPKSPIDTSPKLEHPAVGPLKDPITQQKRRSSNRTANMVEDVSCAGIDGSPWPEETDEKKHAVDDDREYFKHHKASPLSELEFADTRTPISKATADGSTQNSFSIGYESGEVILWREEQLDSAEDSLRRAAQIFSENAAKGDPDSPHGRVLRSLLGGHT